MHHQFYVMGVCKSFALLRMCPKRNHRKLSALSYVLPPYQLVLCAAHIRTICYRRPCFDSHAPILFAFLSCGAWLQSDPASVFAAWAAHNGKSCAPQDLQARLPIFISNVAAQMSRLGLKEGAMEVNGLADISREEFKRTHLGHMSKSLFTELG